MQYRNIVVFMGIKYHMSTSHIWYFWSYLRPELKKNSDWHTFPVLYIPTCVPMTGVAPTALSDPFTGVAPARLCLDNWCRPYRLVWPLHWCRPCPLVFPWLVSPLPSRLTPRINLTGLYSAVSHQIQDLAKLHFFMPTSLEGIVQVFSSH